MQGDAASRDHKQKRAKASNEKDYKEDLINQLPDGLPELILSKLPIKEAARTSILSTKWRYMWTFYSGTLEFDGSRDMKFAKRYLKVLAGSRLTVERTEEMYPVYDEARRTYINLINELLSSLKSPTLEGLKFWFSVGATGYSAVRNWVDFAIQKKVQRLELFFGHTFQCVLPLQKFKLSNFDSLRVLRLKRIYVTKEMLEYLLCSCPLLETLSLIKSRFPAAVKIIGPSLKLKCLEWIRCYSLRMIEISAENLVSFKYYGPSVSIVFKSVPKLEEATFGEFFIGLGTQNFLRQIKVLKLDMAQKETELLCWLDPLPHLINLKHLELVACINDDDDFTLKACVLLFKAAPSLWRFTLKMLNWKPTFRTEGNLTVESKYSIKELEFVGFCGATREVELAIFLVQSSVELQKITIDTRWRTAWCEKYITDTSLPYEAKLKHFPSRDHEENRERALRLQDKIPAGVEFVCL